MKRVKWLSGEWPLSIRQFAQRIRADVLTPEKMSGFLVTRIRESFVEARFVEKLLSEEVLTDPFGAEIRFERLSYVETRFRLAEGFPQVELHNPPRSIAAFSSRFLRLTEFQASWAVLNVDVLRWADGLQRLIGKSAVIDRVHVKDVVYDEAVSLEATLSGTKDVRLAMENLLNGRTYTLDKVQFALDIAGRATRIQLSADASMQGPDSLPEEVITAVREALPQRRHDRP